jgi:hypothetical protein
LDFSSLYDIEKQRALQRQLVSEPQPLADYYYPPFFAVALKPLRLLAYRHAFIAISTLNLLCLGFALGMLIRRLRLDKIQICWLLLVAFTNFGLYMALLKGQTAFISLMIFVLYVTAVIDSDDPVVYQNQPSARYRAGIWAALLCFKPPLAVVPIIVLIAKRKWTSFAR